MKFFGWLLNFFRPRRCPSGLNHKIKIGIVTDKLGNKWCWHDDCMDAAIKVAIQHNRIQEIEADEEVD